MSTDAQWLEWMQSGASRFSAGNFSEAAGFFQKAVELAPTKPQGWANLSSALAAQKQLDSALKAIEKAIQLDPGVMACHMIKGDILRDLQSADAALSAYEQAVSLRRDPQSLNRLAWANRALYRFPEAERLYMEAIKMDPGFNLSKINLASLSLIMGKHDVCRALLTGIDTKNFTRPEYIEYSTIVALYNDYLRHVAPLKKLETEGDDGPLLAELSKPQENNEIDQNMFDRLRKYAETISNTSFGVDEKIINLPDDWDFMEAMFMIPYINTPQEYPGALKDLKDRKFHLKGLLETSNMVDAIGTARAKAFSMSDPVLAELELRRWHSLACRKVPRFMPGHFKYSQNRVIGKEDIERVHPVKTIPTFRAFITDIYPQLQPGLARAIMVLMAVCDMHPFADGNARVAYIWMNRELESAGLMPVLLNRQLNLSGDLSKAMSQVRKAPDDMTPLVKIFTKSQSFARHFCQEVARYKTNTATTISP
jgi:tetratricopeptide (TPR) repeat protein